MERVKKILIFTLIFCLILGSINTALLGVSVTRAQEGLEATVSSSSTQVMNADWVRGRFSAGYTHSLAITPDGTVFAWGFNGTFGKIGNGTGTTTAYPTPIQVSNLTRVAGISSGQYHSLAVKTDGTVWAWGYNNQGRLGDGTTTNRFEPVQTSNLTNVVEVGAGDNFSLALKADGTVWGWGGNFVDQLGDGTQESKSEPIQIQGLSNIVKISTGNLHSLALKDDGTVWSWGSNANGKLGLGYSSHRNGVNQIPGLTDVVYISAGRYSHCLAVKSDGTVWAWGDNRYGQLGDGTTIGQSSPQQVPGLTDIVAVSAGADYSLALKSDGTAMSWGYNRYGQLRDGTTNNQLEPVPVQGLTDVVSISAGGRAPIHGGAGFSFAVKSDGSMWAWGYNRDGQLGDGNTINKTWEAVPNLVNLGDLEPPLWTPDCTFSFSPRNPMFGEEITFDASSFIIWRKNISSYKWDFGDGSTAEGKVVKHNYNQPGNYPVELIVTDETGARYGTKASVVVSVHPMRQEINQRFGNTVEQFSYLMQSVDSASNVGEYFIDKVEEQYRKTVVGLVTGSVSSLMSVADVGLTESIDKLAYSGMGDMAITQLTSLMPDAMQATLYSGEAALGIGLKYLAFDLADEAVSAVGDAVTMNIATEVLGSTLNQNKPFQNHLSPSVQNLVDIFQSDLEKNKNQLLTKDQDFSLEEIELYKEDLQKRALANSIMTTNYYREVALLDHAKARRELSGLNALSTFAIKYGTKLIFKIAADGPGALVHSVGSHALETYQNTERLKEDSRVLGMAFSTVPNAADISRRIYLNTYQGFNNIQTKTTPLIAEGERISVSHKVQKAYSGFLSMNSTVKKAYTEITIKNTGPVETVYEVSAGWERSGLWGKSWGTSLFTDKGSLSIPAGETDSVRVYYLNNSSGEYPKDGTSVTFSISGTTETGTYGLEFLTEPFNPYSFILLGENSEEGIYSYPIISRVEYSAAESEYGLNIFVENPFEEGVDIFLSQEIPPGITVIDADGGNLVDNILTWEATLEPEEVIQLEMIFTCSHEPGTQVELPATKLVMQDLAGEESAEFPAEPISFTQRVPLLASGEPPFRGSSGEEVSIPVTLTNLLQDDFLEGNVVVRLKDKEGNSSEQLLQSITLEAGETLETVLTFFLDAEPGSYRFEGVWQTENTEMNIFKENILVDVSHLLGKVHLEGRQNYGGVTVKLGELTTTTNSDGSFNFSAIENGNYSLEVSEPGYLNYNEMVYVGLEIIRQEEISLSLENEPPTALFNYGSVDPYSTLERTFSAVPSYSLSDEIVSYEWDFGDGNTGEGQAVSHVFEGPGSYEVTLTVTDSNGIEDSFVQEVTVTEGFKLKGLGNLQAVLFEKDTVNLAEHPQNVSRQILLKNSADEPLARLTVHFNMAEEDIDLSGLVADLDSGEHKAVLYMEDWPEEVDEVKYLYIPSTGTGEVYICPEATTLEEVSFESSERVVIEVGETFAGMSLENAVYKNKEYYVVKNITGGGGELIPLQGVSLAEGLTLVARSEPFGLIPVFSPSGATNKNLQWSSDNEEIATVDSDGFITAHKPGVVNISVVTEEGNYTAISTINVFSYGDIRGKGSVNVSDAILVLRHIVGLIDISEEFGPDSLVRARVRETNGDVNVEDAILILKYIVGLIPNFPAEK